MSDSRPDTQVNLTIGGLARSVDVSVETVRYYQRRGLVPQPPRPAGGVRRYGREDVARLRFIREAQSLGFSLDDIGALLALRADGDCCGDVQTVTEEKLARLRETRRRLESMERRLTELLHACRRGAPAGTGGCALLDSLWPPEGGGPTER